MKVGSPAFVTCTSCLRVEKSHASPANIVILPQILNDGSALYAIPTMHVRDMNPRINTRRGPISPCQYCKYAFALPGQLNRFINSMYL